MIESRLLPSEVFAQANEKRDYGLYTKSMDAALIAKAQSIMPYFGDIAEGAVIVDAGSGTGALAELAAEVFRGSHVYALDISHELAERAAEGRALTNIVFGDAAEKNFPDNSIDVKYFSTSGHEVETFGGPGRMTTAVENTYDELKPGGKIIIRDFCKPTRTEPIYMSLLSENGVDDPLEATNNGILDYSLLSQKALFLKFHEEFRGGNAFDYEIVTIDGKELIKLTPEWAHEFYLRKDYTENWRQEIKEKYTYWTEGESRDILHKAGYTNIQVVPDPNEFILENRLKGQIALFEEGTNGELIEFAFPSTHMVVVGEKPKTEDGNETSYPDKIITGGSYQKAKETIMYDETNNAVTIGSQTFAVSPDIKPVTGSKKTVYHLAGEPARVLKVARTDALNDHSIFKAMYQSIARQNLLDEHGVPHLRILDIDPDGPPFRYFIQEAAPDTSISAAELVRNNTLKEPDVEQMASFINDFELAKTWQIDTNPFNWHRTIQEDGSTQMIYVDGKVYLYEEEWEFRRIGLLQWLNPVYVTNLPTNSALIPKETQYEFLKAHWNTSEDEHVKWWKKYLHPTLQPQ